MSKEVTRPKVRAKQLKVNRVWMFTLSLISFLTLLFVSSHYEQDAVQPHNTIQQYGKYMTITDVALKRSVNNTIIVTYASYNYRANLINWLVGLNRFQIRNYLIVCLDNELHTFLLQRNIYCYPLPEHISSQSHQNSNKQRSSKQSSKLNVEAIKDLWEIRVKHLVLILEKGVSVVFSDADAVWVKDPFAEGLLTPTMGDIVASRGQWPYPVSSAWGSTLCMGLIYFRSTRYTITLIRSALHTIHETKDDQVSINNALYYGSNPPNSESGRRSSGNGLVFRQQKNDGLGFTKMKKLSFSKDKGMAVAIIRRVRVVLLPHRVVPRHCNVLSKENWKDHVVVAHCHARDGVTAKNYNNWGDDKARVSVLEKYKLWCLRNKDWEELKGNKFSEWLQVTAHSCILPIQ